jgi:hypothetical protein
MDIPFSVQSLPRDDEEFIYCGDLCDNLSEVCTDFPLVGSGATADCVRIANGPAGVSGQCLLWDGTDWNIQQCFGPTGATGPANPICVTGPLTGSGIVGDCVRIEDGPSGCGEQLQFGGPSSYNPNNWDIYRAPAATEVTVGNPGSSALYPSILAALTDGCTSIRIVSTPSSRRFIEATDWSPETLFPGVNQPVYIRISHDTQLILNNPVPINIGDTTLPIPTFAQSVTFEGLSRSANVGSLAFNGVGPAGGPYFNVGGQQTVTPVGANATSNLIFQNLNIQFGAGPVGGGAATGPIVGGPGSTVNAGKILFQNCRLRLQTGVASPVVGDPVPGAGLDDSLLPVEFDQCEFIGTPAPAPDNRIVDNRNTDRSVIMTDCSMLGSFSSIGATPVIHLAAASPTTGSTIAGLNYTLTGQVARIEAGGTLSDFQPQAGNAFGLTLVPLATNLTNITVFDMDLSLSGGGVDMTNIQVTGGVGGLFIITTGNHHITGLRCPGLLVSSADNRFENIELTGSGAADIALSAGAADNQFNNVRTSTFITIIGATVGGNQFSNMECGGPITVSGGAFDNSFINCRTTSLSIINGGLGTRDTRVEGCNLGALSLTGTCARTVITGNTIDGAVALGTLNDGVFANNTVVGATTSSSFMSDVAITGNSFGAAVTLSDIFNLTISSNKFASTFTTGLTAASSISSNSITLALTTGTLSGGVAIAGNFTGGMTIGASSSDFSVTGCTVTLADVAIGGGSTRFTVDGCVVAMDITGGTASFGTISNCQIAGSITFTALASITNMSISDCDVGGSVTITPTSALTRFHLQGCSILTAITLSPGTLISNSIIEGNTVTGGISVTAGSASNEVMIANCICDTGALVFTAGTTMATTVISKCTVSGVSIGGGTSTTDTTIEGCILGTSGFVICSTMPAPTRMTISNCQGPFAGMSFFHTSGTATDIVITGCQTGTTSIRFTPRGFSNLKITNCRIGLDLDIQHGGLTSTDGVVSNCVIGRNIRMGLAGSGITSVTNFHVSNCTALRWHFLEDTTLTNCTMDGCSFSTGFDTSGLAQAITISALKIQNSLLGAITFDPLDTGAKGGGLITGCSIGTFRDGCTGFTSEYILSNNFFISTLMTGESVAFGITGTAKPGSVSNTSIIGNTTLGQIRYNAATGPSLMINNNRLTGVAGGGVPNDASIFIDSMPDGLTINNNRLGSPSPAATQTITLPPVGGSGHPDTMILGNHIRNAIGLGPGFLSFAFPGYVLSGTSSCPSTPSLLPAGSMDLANNVAANQVFA